MSGLITLLFILAFGMILGALFLKFKMQSTTSSDNIKDLENEFNKLGLIASSKIITPSNHHLIIIDESSEKLVILSKHPSISNNIFTHIYNFSDIISSKIIENGNQVTVTSRKSQIGGALVGGAIAGGVGALIGGLSGKKITTQNDISQLEVRMNVNDLKNPVTTISFLPRSIPSKSNDPMLLISRTLMNQLHGALTVIIRRNETIVQN